MFISKHKKAIVSLTVVAVIALGGATAFAASAGVSLTPAGYVDISKVDFTPGTFTVVEGVTPNIEGGDTYTTAPGFSLTAVSGNIDTANIQEGTLTVVGGVTPQIVGGYAYTTAAK